MASGRLGANDLSASTDTTLYTVPAQTFTIASVSFCNRGNQTITIRLSVSDADVPTASEYIEYETEIPPKGVLERTGIALGAAQKLVVRANSANVSAVGFGVETPLPSS
jgi:hypothetical protein